MPSGAVLKSHSALLESREEGVCACQLGSDETPSALLESREGRKFADSMGRCGVALGDVGVQGVL